MPHISVKLDRFQGRDAAVVRTLDHPPQEFIVYEGSVPIGVKEGDTFLIDESLCDTAAVSAARVEGSLALTRPTNTMTELLKSYVRSKKVRAMLFGLLVSFGAKFGLHLDNETVAVLLSPVLTYMLSQGLADTGKTAALINATEARPAAVVEDEVAK